MNVTGNSFQSFPTVISGIESGHRGIQSLGSTDIGRSFLPFDMLFTGLQSQTQCMISLCINRHTDNTSHDVTFVFLSRCHVSSMRSTVRHRDTETLRCSHNHVSTPFSRRSQQHEAHHVSHNRQQCTVRVYTISKSLVITNLSVSSRVLDNSTEYIRGKFKRVVIPVNQLDSLRGRTGDQHVLRLRENLVINKQFVGTRFFHLFTAQTVHHRH